MLYRGDFQTGVQRPSGGGKGCLEVHMYECIFTTIKVKGGVQCCFVHSELFTLLKSWILMLSMAKLKKKLGKTKKTLWKYDWVFRWQKSSFRVRTCFRKFFSIMALADINDGGTPYMGISPGKTMHRTRSGRMSLKKCVFGCFSSVFVDKRFINKAQFDAGFAHRLILKDGAVPAIKDPGHDSELQMVSETASNVSVLLAIGA